MGHVACPVTRFGASSAIKGREEVFVQGEAMIAPVLASWRESLFAHEWLHQDGKIRKPSEMNEKMRLRRMEIEELIDGDKILERPVLGIGILDNIEIGAGRDLFLACAARGMERIPVHIPKSHVEDFRLFIRFPE